MGEQVERAGQQHKNIVFSTLL